jgi:hypothetical protein
VQANKTHHTEDSLLLLLLLLLLLNVDGIGFYTYKETKPNRFEIISLQTTRKENNWKTEEKLARAVVTLETERIKGSNPSCL